VDEISGFDAGVAVWHVPRKLPAQPIMPSHSGTIANAAGRLMSIRLEYAVGSRPGANMSLRWWTMVARTVLDGLLFLTELVVVVTAALVTGVVYHLVIYRESGEIAYFLQVGVLAASIFCTLNLLRNEYRLANFFTIRAHFRRLFQLWNLTFIGLLGIGFLTKVTVIYSRGWILLFYVCGAGAALLLRYVLVDAVVLGTKAGLVPTPRIFVVGTERRVAAFAHRHVDANLVGCALLTAVSEDGLADSQRQPLDRELRNAVASARDLAPDIILLLMPWGADEAINHCTESFATLPVEIHLGPEQIFDKFDNAELSKLGAMRSLQLTRLPLSVFELTQKRLFDLAVASLLSMLLAPAIIIIAILIKLDSRGPVFFLQRRYGFNQRPFRIIKFRTMHTLEDGIVIRQATRDDPRATRIGRWLRRWNIDEIPQLFNVLKGDMSLVGPRPHAVSHNRQYEHRIALYARRHNVKPGITGWAQIHGYRGETNTDERMRKRIEYDLYYIDHWSLWLDARILVQTVFSSAAYRNAH